MAQITSFTKPSRVIPKCPKFDQVGSIPYMEKCECALKIKSQEAPIDPLLTTPAAVAYKMANTNSLVKFGTSTYYIDTNGIALKF